MRKAIRLVSLILAVLLMAASFAACAEAPPATTTSPATTSGAATTATDSEKMDFTGVKLKAICYEQQAKDNELVSQAINERLGFEIEWIVCPATEGWAAQERLLAADPTIDIFYLGTARMSTFLSKGYLMDLTPYTTDERFPNILQHSVPLAEGTAASDGKYYGLPIPAIGGYGSTNGYGLVIRQDLLADAGLSMPQTMDDLDAILAAFKAMDPSKYPLFEASPAGLGTLGTVFARSYSEAGVGWWLDESDGQLKHYIQHPDIVNFVEKMAEYYSKGYLHPEFVSANTQATTTLMSSGDVSVVAAWCTNPINPNAALMEQDPEARFDFLIGAPEGPADKGLLGTPAASTFMGVNVACKNPDAVMAAFDFFLTEEGTRLGAWGIEGTNYVTLNDTVTRATGDHAYSNQYNPYTNQRMILGYQTGNHYTDTQYRNWYKVFFTPEWLGQIHFEPDAGLLYDYSTGDNRYNELNTVATTYISELFIDIVTGKEKIANWDARIAELESIALNQMVKERNEQWEKYGKAVYKPGNPVLDVSDNPPSWIESFVW